MQADAKLLTRINRKPWWHVPPMDAAAYSKRGKFLASTYKEAEFYGRPNDKPERVLISSPLVGTNQTIERRLFGKTISFENFPVQKRFALDARMKREALRRGYDSIVLMSERGFKRFRATGKIPLTIELNVLDLDCIRRHP
jgi:hypothetical protein